MPDRSNPIPDTRSHVPKCTPVSQRVASGNQNVFTESAREARYGSPSAEREHLPRWDDGKFENPEYDKGLCVGRYRICCCGCAGDDEYVIAKPSFSNLTDFPTRAGMASYCRYSIKLIAFDASGLPKGRTRSCRRGVANRSAVLQGRNQYLEDVDRST